MWEIYFAILQAGQATDDKWPIRILFPIPKATDTTYSQYVILPTALSERYWLHERVSRVIRYTYVGCLVQFDRISFIRTLQLQIYGIKSVCCGPNINSIMLWPQN